MTNKESIAFVIPCLNEEGFISKCLLSLLAQNLEGIHLEIWVVDGMSTDGTRVEVETLAAADSRIHLIDNIARVTPVALNIGLKAAKAEVKVILGAHALVDSNFSKENLAVLREHPECGAVGGIIENVHANEQSELIGKAMRSPFGVGNARFRTGGKSGSVDTVAFGAYRQDVFNKIGYFDERLVRNQDDEFNFRLIKAGYEIWFDNRIKSFYAVRASYAKLSKQYYQYGYWKVFVNRLHGSITTIRQLIPAFFVVSLFFTLFLGLVNSLYLWLLVIVILSWLIAAIIAASVTHTAPKRWPALIRVFFILHFQYGLGYLHGVLNFILLRKSPNVVDPAITR